MTVYSFIFISSFINNKNNISKKIRFLQRCTFTFDKINSHPYISKEELESAVENELYTSNGVEDTGIKSRTIEHDLHETPNSPAMCKEEKCNSDREIPGPFEALSSLSVKPFPI